MSDQIRSSVSQYYTGKLEEFGTTSRGVDWNSEESQVVRFKQLCKVLPEDRDSPFSVLDYGCGYGAMRSFLNTRFSDFHYTGFDISSSMIAAATKANPPDAKTVWTSDSRLLKPVDFSIASGIFNVKMDFGDEEWKKYILDTLKGINALSIKGFSFNILTSYSDREFMRPTLYYADPGFLFDFCKRNFSRQVALLHDYQLYEFTVIVRKP